MKFSCVYALYPFLALNLVQTSIASDDFFQCVQISGGNSNPITLRPTSGTPSLNQSYTSPSLPFQTAKHKVTNFKLDAKCTSNGAQAAPTCTWDVTLSYCDIGGRCNASDKTFRSGTFNASGTGPTAYFIPGSGTGSFEGVTGSIDSELNLQTFNLEKVQMNLCSKNVSYGDKIILQVNSLDNRWLTGGRLNGNERVFTRDKLSSTYESTTAAESYQWIVRSEVGNGGRVTMDPKNGRCVKYGDKVHLQVNNLDNRWLTGGRGTGNEGVGTRNKLGSNYERTTAATAYEWIIRATPGNGKRSDKDTSVGRCVELGDVINLQVNNLDNRWLTGGRGGGNEGVGTRDRFRNGATTTGEYERVTAGHSYEWIVLSEFGDGTRP